MEALLLSLGAALAWGTADFGAGLKTRRLSAFAVVGGMQLIGAIGAAALLLVAPNAGLTSDTALLGIAAGAVTSVGLATLYQGLAIGPMSLVAPLSATGVVVPVFVGLATGDDPSPAQGIGMLLAIAGMLIAVRSSTHTSADAADGSRLLALGLGALSAVGLGVYYLTANAVSDGQGAWFSLLGQMAAFTILALVVVVRAVPAPSRSDLGAIAVLGLVSFAAWILSQTAFDAGHLSLTATVISVYPVVTIVLATTVAREAVPSTQALGLVGVFVGVALIAAA